MSWSLPASTAPASGSAISSVLSLASRTSIPIGQSIYGRHNLTESTSTTSIRYLTSAEAIYRGFTSFGYYQVGSYPSPMGLDTVYYILSTTGVPVPGTFIASGPDVIHRIA
jgi:hypothetical protein